MAIARIGPTRPPRRFTPPWTVEEATESFCIRDANGQALAYVYFEDETGPAAMPTATDVCILSAGLRAPTAKMKRQSKLSMICVLTTGPQSAQFRGGESMIRFLAAILFSTLVMQMPVNAQQPATPSSAADYVLVTVVLRHDQSRNLEEITKLLDDSGFWTKFPPEGVTVESWYVAMGLGHVVTLRVSPARLREVNRSIEQNAWKAFRTEVYLTYDFREIARSQREKALAK
jgi:hypothetical protein